MHAPMYFGLDDEKRSMCV